MCTPVIGRDSVYPPTSVEQGQLDQTGCEVIASVDVRAEAQKSSQENCWVENGALAVKCMA
jgi:hypothetical protein